MRTVNGLGKSSLAQLATVGVIATEKPIVRHNGTADRDPVALQWVLLTQLNLKFASLRLKSVYLTACLIYVSDKYLYPPVGDSYSVTGNVRVYYRTGLQRGVTSG